MSPNRPEEVAFQLPPEQPVLDGVHVWRIRRGDLELLSESEQERATAFRSDEARAAFVAGRSGVRAIGARYTGIPPAGLDLQVGAAGKPFFANAGLAFNVSHSGDAVVAAFSGEPVGVDIERSGRRGDFLAIANRFFPPDEVEGISGEEDFLRLWTAKEAMLKLTGVGISGGLEAAQPGRDGVGDLGGSPVWVKSFRMGDYRGAVASFQPFEVKGWFEM